MRYGSKVLFDDVTTTFSVGPPLRPDRTERRRQVDVHEAADRRAAAAEGHGRRARRSSACCARISSRSTSSACIDTVIMGNARLWAALEERERLYAKADMTDEDGMRLGELEGDRRRGGRLHGRERRGDPAAGARHPGGAARRKMAELQGGQKVRVLLAQALFGNPQALLLDEPTNHLDLDSIHWLERVPRPLRRARSIVISHDRHFLNARLHAHRRHRLPDHHHLHRRLRRHGDGEDADPLARSSRTTRSARRRSRS